MRKFRVTIENKSYEVGVEEIGEDGTSVVTEIKQTEKSVSVAPKAQTNVKGTKVEAPFPGLIKEIKVANGTAVKKEQPILVLEAMKMDNDITAPCDGIVTIQVTKGSNVESGTVLAIIG